MKDYLQTVTGPVAREDMGLTLPHEHLFNDLSSVVDAPCYPFSQRLVDKKVTAEIQWALKHDPYCCADNMDRKPIEDVIFEINNFISLGGRTIVDATGSESIGRDAQALREVALKTGLNIVASSGPYLEKFESQRIHKTVDELATTIDKELNQGIGDTDIRAGMIGEIGVSPTFTEAEHNSLRAASLAQINNPHVAMNIHMPGWLRRGDEVLDIVLDKGVWLEFDMIGLDITFPKEGIAPGVQETADAVAHLIELGYADQLVLSHDVFLKQMWAKNGGNGWGFVPDVFLAYLAERGVDKTILKKLCIDNPGRLLTA
ncbi:phosphotriesterase [Escherichia coli]|nr:phosphotriesterase [Escherichia coli]